MNELMKIKEVASLTGVTVRTLHYYDEIGLLVPTQMTEAGYRLYDQDALMRLQQILFFKELDFPLNQIKEIICSTHFDEKSALNNHKKLLLQKRDRLDQLITLVNKTLEGENDMSFKEFDQSELERSKQEYAKEVKERWGHTDAYQQNSEKTKSYDKHDWERLSQEGNAIFKEFYAIIEKEPSSKEAQNLVQKWKDYLTANYYDCNNDILAGLGQMYQADARFKKNIDKHGEGLTDFISKAIAIYCDKQ